jgi:hypothetical protein
MLVRIQVMSALVGFDHMQNRRRRANSFDAMAPSNSHPRQSRGAVGGSDDAAVAIGQRPAQALNSGSPQYSRACAAADHRNGIDGGAGCEQRIHAIAKRERNAFEHRLRKAAVDVS